MQMKRVWVVSLLLGASLAFVASGCGNAADGLGSSPESSAASVGGDEATGSAKASPQGKEDDECEDEDDDDKGAKADGGRKGDDKGPKADGGRKGDDDDKDTKADGGSKDEDDDDFSGLSNRKKKDDSADGGHSGKAKCVRKDGGIS